MFLPLFFRPIYDEVFVTMTTETETVTVTGEVEFEYDVDNLDSEGDPKQQAKRLAENSLREHPEILQEKLSASLSGE